MVRAFGGPLKEFAMGALKLLALAFSSPRSLPSEAFWVAWSIQFHDLISIDPVGTPMMEIQEQAKPASDKTEGGEMEKSRSFIAKEKAWKRARERNRTTTFRLLALVDRNRWPCLLLLLHQL